MNTKREVLDLGRIELDGLRVTQIEVCSIHADGTAKDDVWLWSADPVETHHLADRCGGPYGISDIVTDSEGDHWFIFCVADSYFPVYDLVRGDSFEDAYEYYEDFAAEHRGIKIEEPDLKDYLVDGEYTCNVSSSGVPISTENIHGQQVRLVSMRFEKGPDFKYCD